MNIPKIGATNLNFGRFTTSTEDYVKTKVPEKAEEIIQQSAEKAPDLLIDRMVGSLGALYRVTPGEGIKSNRFPSEITTPYLKQAEEIAEEFQSRLNENA